VKNSRATETGNLHSFASDEEKRIRLRRMKRLPLVLLGLMLVLFLFTLHRAEPWLGWVHAFAEAGMVGALADWFAVVALFRHPMGIPIPHTAIIPKRKNEIGESMADFVAEHFLHPEVVRRKLESVNMAKNMAIWLKSPAGHDRVLELGISLMRWMLGALHEDRVRRFIKRLGSRHLARIEPAPLIGRTLDWLIQDGRHQQVLTQSLRFAIVLLHENRSAIRGNVQRESPWWMPGFVDDKIVLQMLERIETLLFEMSLDPDHPMRSDFNAWVEQWAIDLQNSSEYRRWGHELRRDLLENEDLQDYIYQLWTDFVRGFEQELDDPESAVRQQLSLFITSVAEEIEGDADMQAWVNGWLLESTVSVVDGHRYAIASLISDTVRRWDAKETSLRVELAIGRDLQFIRINGTLVGGLVGLAIHAIKLI
jgi:uncharacterized membrane-anchored protein YjiN (DUF445 family)